MPEFDTLIYQANYKRLLKPNQTTIEGIITSEAALKRFEYSIFSCGFIFCPIIYNDEEIIKYIAQNVSYVILDRLMKCLEPLFLVLGIRYSMTTINQVFQSNTEPSLSISLEEPFMYKVPMTDCGLRRRFNHVKYNMMQYLMFHHEKNFRSWTPVAIDACLRAKFDSCTEHNIYSSGLRNYLLIVFQGVTTIKPLPRYPYVNTIGGRFIGEKIDKMITSELQAFINHDPDKPLILVSFGSLINCLPIDTATDLFRALGSLRKFKFIMRFRNRHNNKIPENVLITDWLPQNEILSLPGTKMFITHGGSNSINEAMFHKVPLIVMLVFLDQFTFAKHTRNIGVGEEVRFTKINETLTQSILKVITNSTYADNVKRFGSIIRAMEPDPADKAARIISHDISYGDRYSSVENMESSLLVQLMLDVCLMTISSVTFFFLFVIRCN